LSRYSKSSPSVGFPSFSAERGEGSFKGGERNIRGGKAACRLSSLGRRKGKRGGGRKKEGGGGRKKRIRSVRADSPFSLVTFSTLSYVEERKKGEDLKRSQPHPARGIGTGSPVVHGKEGRGREKSPPKEKQYNGAPQTHRMRLVSP